MKKFKLDRNIYIFVGFVFLLCTFLALRFLQLHELTANTRVIVPILSGIACILMFINAYINHKKVIKGSKG